MALSALGRASVDAGAGQVAPAIARGGRWLIDALDPTTATAAPLGLYFARLWYYEELYPLIFSVEGLARVRAMRPPVSAAAGLETR